MSSHTLSHVDAEGRPRMVDVGAKAVTRREACAEASVVFPAEVAESLRAQAMRSATDEKTPVAVPTRPPLPDGCFALEPVEVAAEALVRVIREFAAATVYDMCKALSHAIRIEDVVVVAKSGGRDNFDHRGAD